MYPVLTKSGYKKLLLPTGQRVCSYVIRYAGDKSDDIQLPPEPTTCCMSGCANCVWIEYAQTVAKLLDGNSDKAREMVLEKIEDPNLRVFLSIELKNIKSAQNDTSKDEKPPTPNESNK